MPTYVEIGDAEIAAESPVTVSIMTRLRDNALAYAGAPSGTRAMWQQTSAPLGWTKESLYNDYVPRVVTGSVSTGGSVNFSTLFGRTTTDSVTLTQAVLPNVNFIIPSGQGSHVHSHLHSGFAESDPGGFLRNEWIDGNGVDKPTASATLPEMYAQSGGSATPFSPAVDMRCKYIDNIIAQKD